MKLANKAYIVTLLMLTLRIYGDGSKKSQNDTTLETLHQP